MHHRPLSAHERKEYEMLTRAGRLARYERRLLHEGFCVARDLDVTVLLPQLENDTYDARALMELGARTLPALYSRVLRERERLLEDLER